MNSYDDMRLIAVSAFLGARNRTFEAFYSNICRWYSREFSTPLNEVFGYAEEFVLKIYFEDNYWRLFESKEEEAVQELEKTRQKLLKSEDEIEKDQEDDDAWVAAFEERIGQIVDKHVEKIKPNLSKEIEEHKDIVLAGESGPPED